MSLYGIDRALRKTLRPLMETIMGQKPILIWAIAYLVGLVLGNALMYFPMTLLGLGGIGAGIYFMRSRFSPLLRWDRFLVTAFFIFGAAHMLWTSDPSDNPDLSRFVGLESVLLQGQVDSPVSHRPGRSVDDTNSALIFVDAMNIQWDGIVHPVRGRVRLTAHGFDPNVSYGDIVQVTTMLRPITSFRNPGGFDYAKYMEREEILARAVIGRSEGFRILGHGGNPLLRQIYSWRDKIRSAIVQSMSPQGSAILQAMIIGESGFITERLRDIFMISGVVHILSISGSHLSLLALVIFSTTIGLLKCLPSHYLLFLGRYLQPPRIAAVLTFFAVVFYALLAGSQIATVRSLIMILVYLGSVWLMRQHDPLYSLSIAVLIVTLREPNGIFDISFQLSYGAILAIVLGIRVFQKSVGMNVTRDLSIKGGWRKIGMVCLVTAVAGIGTAPIVAHHFNQFSWVGVLANPVIMPIVGGLIVPLGLVSSVAVIVTGSTDLPFAGVQDFIIHHFVRIVEIFSKLPGAEIHVSSPPPSVIFLWYVASWFLLFFQADASRRLITGSLCFLMTVPWILGVGEMNKERFLRVSYLDVGQGDSALIEFPSGKTMLIDAGIRIGHFDAGRLAVAPYLWDRGISRIDFVVLSHPQVDHAGGLALILQKFEVGEVWTNGIVRDAVFFKRFVQTSKDRGIPVKVVERDMPDLKIADSTIQILHPGAELLSLSENDRSIVLRIRYGNQSFLFTGDIEAEAERWMIGSKLPLKSSVLKIPHHGSRSSIDPNFLIQVAPKMGVISAGAGNRYHHPAPETVEAYRLLGTHLFRTDIEGAVVFVTDGVTIDHATYSDYALETVSWGEGMFFLEWENLKKWLRVFVGSDPA